MNHQAIIDQLTTLAPQLKEASSPEDVLIKYAQDRNWSPAQLERVGQFYNIAKTLNFMDKSAARGDSFKVLDNEGMLSKFTKHEPKSKATSENKEAAAWASWFETPTKSASEDTEKFAIIKEENGQYTVYSEDGSKRLSKPGTKAEAVKRLRQVEYFKKHKKANTVPNIIAAAREEAYSPFVDVDEQQEFKSASQLIKEELAEEANRKFEIESTERVIFEAQTELYKIANELLEMHRLSPIPYDVMERDAFYCADSAPSVQKAANVIANYFNDKGWTLPRHNYGSAAPRLVRDTYNSAPLFKSAAAQLDLLGAANMYKEDILKKYAAAPSPTGTSGPKKKERDDSQPDEGNIPGGAKSPESGGSRNEPEPPKPEPKKEYGASRGEQASFIQQILYPKNKEQSGGDKDDGASEISAAKSIASGIRDMYSPKSYMTDQQKQFLESVLKSPTLPTKNVRQRKVDEATSNVGRVATLQRLMLQDPIIGEADPDTVISLYNTLAKANPEIVSDANLLRFALREAIQYEAVPMHTYKDLISMGKDRADSNLKNLDLTNKKYSID